MNDSISGDDMQRFSLTKGRKKEVAKFTARRGLLVVGLMILFGIVLVLLMVVGWFRVDAH